jgi:hypothetical protein
MIPSKSLMTRITHIAQFEKTTLEELSKRPIRELNRVPGLAKLGIALLKDPTQDWNASGRKIALKFWL